MVSTRVLVIDAGTAGTGALILDDRASVLAQDPSTAGRVDELAGECGTKVYSRTGWSLAQSDQVCAAQYSQWSPVVARAQRWART